MAMFRIMMYVRDPKTPLRYRLDRFKDPYISFRSWMGLRILALKIVPKLYLEII